MKALLLRISALGTVLALGWIAVANAQRGSNDSTASDVKASTVSASADSTSPSDEPNPLRNAGALRSTRSSSAVNAGNGASSRRTVADPFGLQTHRNNGPAEIPASATEVSDPAPEDSIPNASDNQIAATPYPSTPSAEPNTSGPSLGPIAAGRSNNDRYADRSNRSDNRQAQHFPASQTADNQEPAPFRADPSASPAQTRTNSSATNTLSPLNSSTGATGEADGVGQPGARQLEGIQSPQVTIQKLAPKEIQVGKPAKFRIVVRNAGQTPACDVEIYDVIPRGTRLIDTTPQASAGTRGDVVWTMGTLQPGEESAVEMQLMPMTEGEIGSVATVHFGADASARCVATRPQLAVQTSAAGSVLIGEKLTLSIVVSNPGTGVATGVVLDERIPPGFQHPAGAELEYEVGDLKPGESRTLELPLQAVQPGQVKNLLYVRGDGNLKAEDQLDIEVLAPQLDVAVEGPKRRYLERQAVYTMSVTNPGTASAKQVELLASLPPGLKFVSANNAGYYDEATRTVHWRLEELPANETGPVELVTLPVTAGQYAIKLRGTAQKGLAAEKEQPVVIEGVAAILFQVADSADPIEVNGETTYDVRVVNQGSKAAMNVQLTVELPAQVKPIGAEGPTRNHLEGNRVVFDRLAQLAPKAETTYRLRIKASQPGDLRARFQLMTDDMQTPVTKEESTRVFADE